MTAATVSDLVPVEGLGVHTFGRVSKVVHRSTGEHFALKKVSVDDGVPEETIREMSILQGCEHPNVIRLLEVLTQERSLYLMFEWMHEHLRMFVRLRGFRSTKALKRAVHQCFAGIKYCHDHQILHRDVTPYNILVADAGRHLKLAGFGCARTFSLPLRPLTHEVVTLWYRAPEILLGQGVYGPGIDIWALGCTIAEMATREPLFPGNCEIDTIFKIFRKLGTPSEERWPGISTLPDFKQTFPKWADTGFADVRAAGTALRDHGVELLRACLTYNPAVRLSAQQACQHRFFATTGMAAYQMCNRNLLAASRAERQTLGCIGGPCGATLGEFFAW